jgi:hypothetical protein
MNTCEFFLKYMGKMAGAGAAQKCTGSATLIAYQKANSLSCCWFGTGTGYFKVFSPSPQKRHELSYIKNP